MTPSLTLRTATACDLPELIALWQTVFGDDEAFIRAFYNAVGIDRTIVATALSDEAANSAIVGMINCPEVALWAGDAHYSGAYIYALAVEAHYRSCGIGSALLEAAESGAYFAKAPLFTLLIPAEASLFDFYAKKGYDRPAFPPKIPESLPSVRHTAPLPHDSDALYDRYLTACRSESANGALFVKPQALFALSMGSATCYPLDGGYIALDKCQKAAEMRPAIPDLSRKKALWKALADIPDHILPLISRFMED